MEFVLAADTRCSVAESCLWDAERQRVWYCDIYGGAVHGFTPATGARERLDMGEPVGSLALCRDGRLLVALSSVLVLVDPADARRRAFARIDGMDVHARLNDGKAGPDGCFWVGSCDERPDKQAIGALYRVRPDGAVERKADGFRCANGLAWSADGRTMYLSDSRGPWIDRCDFDPASGAMAQRRRIAVPDARQGRPDGAACDAAGHYWSAGVSAGCLNCFDRDGRLLASVALPVPAPTMPCFTPAGLFVTSLRRGLAPSILDRTPGCGGLWWAPAQRQAVPHHLFALP